MEVLLQAKAVLNWSQPHTSWVIKQWDILTDKTKACSVINICSNTLILVLRNSCLTKADIKKESWQPSHSLSQSLPCTILANSVIRTMPPLGLSYISLPNCWKGFNKMIFVKIIFQFFIRLNYNKNVIFVLILKTKVVTNKITVSSVSLF